MTETLTPITDAEIAELRAEISEWRYVPVPLELAARFILRFDADRAESPKDHAGD